MGASGEETSQKGNKLMKTITTWNFKGGVGKTTTSYHVAAELARRGLRVLLIDTDEQMNLSSMFEADFKKNAKKKSILELFNGNASIKDCISKSRIENISYIKGSSIAKENCNEIAFDVLRQKLDEIKEMFDFCIIDCHPDKFKVTENAIYAADTVLVPIKLDTFSRNNLNDVVEELNRVEALSGKNGIDYLAFANFISISKGQLAVFEDLMTTRDYSLADIGVLKSADIDNANYYRKPVYKHRSKSKSANDYVALTDALIERLGV